MRTVYVYILANHARTLYVGMTNDLERRIFEHKTRRVPGFASQYNIDALVYYEEAGSAIAAIEREKELNGWLRVKKVALVESINPLWDDLSIGWFGAGARFRLPASTHAGG